MEKEEKEDERGNGSKFGEIQAHLNHKKTGTMIAYPLGEGPQTHASHAYLAAMHTSVPHQVLF